MLRVHKHTCKRSSIQYSWLYTYMIACQAARRVRHKFHTAVWLSNVLYVPVDLCHNACLPFTSYKIIVWDYVLVSHVCSIHGLFTVESMCFPWYISLSPAGTPVCNVGSKANTSKLKRMRAVWTYWGHVLFPWSLAVQLQSQASFGWIVCANAAHLHLSGSSGFTCSRKWVLIITVYAGAV